MRGVRTYFRPLRVQSQKRLRISAIDWMLTKGTPSNFAKEVSGGRYEPYLAWSINAD